MTRELLTMALDALEVNYSDYIYDGAGPAIAGAFESDIAAIRTALAQPAIDGFGGNLDSAFDAPAPAPVVPDGWVMVPREPTREQAAHQPHKAADEHGEHVIDLQAQLARGAHDDRKRALPPADGRHLRGQVLHNRRLVAAR